MKEWYIKINDKEEGPFSILELRRDRRVNPDTLVRKKGFSIWKPARDVIELKEIFKDSETPPKDEKEGKDETVKKGDEVLALSYDPFQFWLIVLVVLLIVLYLVYRNQ